MIRRFLALLLAFAATVAFADDEGFVPLGTPGDGITVSLVTFQPGTEYWQRFGHDAIVLRETATGRAIAYNYGIFDFREKNFFLNFARGHMTYQVAPNWLVDDLPIYQEDGRWALEQRLEMTPEQRGWLRDYLDWNVQPENRKYPYDYFVSNCSTRVRDALDRALGGALHRELQGKATGYDYRKEALRLISPDLPLMIAMDAALGPPADRPIDLWQQSFGPMTLMHAVRSVKVAAADGSERPLVQSENYLLPVGTLADPPAAPPDLRLPFLIAGLLSGGLLFGLSLQRRHRAARLAFAGLSTVFSLVCGLAGVVLALLWGVTDHWAGWQNQNLLTMNPLCLSLLPACVMSLRTGWKSGQLSVAASVVIAAASALALVVRQLPALYQDNLHWILLLLPIHLALMLAFLRNRRT